MLGYFIYLNTAKRYKDKKQMKAQDEEAAGGQAQDIELSKDVDMQVRSFVDVPLGSK